MKLKLLHRVLMPLEEVERIKLCTDILALEATIPGHTSHNQGGWRSGPDWLTGVPWLRDRIAGAIRILVPAIDPMSLRGWCVVNRKGAFHKRHTHSGSYQWSGVLYLADGGARAATVFERDGMKPPTVVRVEPEPGLIALFDPQMAHSVEVHTSRAPRITVAFDAKTVRAAS